MKQRIKEWTAGTFLYDAVQALVFRRWLAAGRPVPPNEAVKERVVKQYARLCNAPVFVETGTLHGNMTYAVKDLFDQIFTIELSPSLCEKARRRFDRFPHIRVLEGDSARVLPKVLVSVRRPCLLWLDAHYSGEGTARSGPEAPIRAELGAALRHQDGDPVVLIDDARCFNGRGEYPTLEALRELVAAAGSDWRFEVRHDIIRICRPHHVPAGPDPL